MKIFQIHYNEESKKGLNRLFIPFDNSTPDRPNEFEYGVMRKLYFDPKTWDKNKYLGVFSWKFEQKTRLQPAKLIQWLKAQKGADVYTVNPFTNMNFPQFKNVWLQGEYFHPGMVKFVEMLFIRSGLDPTEIMRTHKPMTTCYCNYWIANKRFWDIFMEHTEKLYKYIQECEDKEILDRLYHIKADVQIDSGMFSFIFERMFSTVLTKYQNEFKVRPYYT